MFYRFFYNIFKNSCGIVLFYLIMAVKFVGFYVLNVFTALIVMVIEIFVFFNENNLNSFFQKAVDIFLKMQYYIILFWAVSSVGRASVLHADGQRFESSTAQVKN